MRRGVKVTFAVMGSLLVTLFAIAIDLCRPRMPSASSFLKFEGFVLLPKKKFFELTDYVTVNGQNIYLANVSAGVVYKVTLRTNAPPSSAKVSELEGVPGAHGVVIDSVSGLGFASSAGDNSVAVFNPTTMHLIKRISVPPSPDAITYDPVDKLIYVPSHEAKLASLIDPATLSVRSTISLGGDSENAVYDEQSERLYQNLPDQSAVAVIDVKEGRIVRKWPLAGCLAATGIAVDEPDGRLFVVCAVSSELLVLNIGSGHIVATIQIGFGGDTVAYDRSLHRLYATGLTGKLTIIEQETPDAYRVLDTVDLAFNAHTLAVNPANHDVIVAYGGYGAAPRLALFKPVDVGER